MSCSNKSKAILKPSKLSKQEVEKNRNGSKRIAFLIAKMAQAEVRVTYHDQKGYHKNVKAINI